MNGIRADLAAHAARREPDEEDEDLYGGVPQVTARVSAAPAAPAQGEPPRRRRRQARLQVLSGEEAK